MLSSAGTHTDFADDEYFASSRQMGEQWSVSRSQCRLIPIKMDAAIFKI